MMTDLSGPLPSSLAVRPRCHNGTCHVPAPRGSRSGTQCGLPGAQAAKADRKDQEKAIYERQRLRPVSVDYSNGIATNVEAERERYNEAARQAYWETAEAAE